MRRILPVFFLLLSVSACKSKKEVVFPERKSITHSVYASGVIKSRNQYQVFANVPGVIAKVYVSIGDIVKQGQPIVLINNRAAQLSRDNSQIAASFNSFQNNKERLDELKYNIEVARQKKEVDSLLYVRQLNLWKQNVGSKVELEQKELNSKNSQSAFESAMIRYEQLKKQMEFADRQSKKQFEISSAQAGDLQVKSEFNGKVFNVLKYQGEMVTAQTPIAIIGEADNFYLELQVDEYDIAQIREGQKVLITMDSYRGQVFEAAVSKIYPIMNERSKTFTLEANFVKAPEKLYPFLTAEANVVIAVKENALLIPRSFLVDEDYVVLESGEKKKVQTGLKDYQKVEIVSGLTEKDAIIRPL